MYCLVLDLPSSDPGLLLNDVPAARSLCLGPRIWGNVCEHKEGHHTLMKQPIVVISDCGNDWFKVNSQHL